MCLTLYQLSHSDLDDGKAADWAIYYDSDEIKSRIRAFGPHLATDDKCGKFVQLLWAVARILLHGGFVADREVADSGLWPSLGFVGLRPTTHSWPEGNFSLKNPSKCLRHPSL